MNIVRQLRQKKGIQQKELAIEIGVTPATVSDWEHGRKNPSGERLRRLAEYFDTEPNVILGREVPDVGNLYVPVVQKLDNQPRTEEARILAKGVDRLPPEQREQALAMFRVMFKAHADYFEKGTETDDT